jgi:diguanylate cyclase (GGDEF)-like protein/PAS domain S-box-containing protein
MSDKNKTKEQLIKEVAELRQRIAELERAETERKRADEALRESEEKYRSLVERANDGITIIQDGIMKYINPRLVEMWGGPLQELIGTPFINYIDPDELPTVLDRYNRRMQGEDVPPMYETVLRRKDGSKAYVELNAGTIAYQGTLADLVFVRDITDRKRVEEALRKSEEKYKELINGMNDTAWVIDFNANFIDVNEAAVKVLGYSREELLSMGPHDIDSSLDAETITGLIKGMQADKLQVFETSHTTKDGKVIPVEIQSSLVTYQGKDAILSIARDITERKWIQEELRQTEERFRKVVETMKVGLGAIDENGVLTYVNEYLAKMLGYSMDEMIGRSTLDFYYDKESRKIQEEIFVKRRAGMRDSSPSEVTLRKKDGEKVHSIQSPTPNFDEGGHYIGSFAIITDITDRKRMEEELRQSEERYRQLFESESDAVMVFDIETLQFEDANWAALELYGYSKEAFLRLQVPDISAEPKKTLEIIGKLKAGDQDGKRVQMRYHRKKDGTVFPVEITNAVFMSGGREKIIGMIRDITERVQAEKTIRRLAYYDALTGLPNRVLFDDRLNRAMVQAHRNQSKLSVMLLDLDQFKDVNDTLGHSVGDELLRSVGKRLTGLLRKHDTVSRMGGDEFYLLLPEMAQVQDAATIAQKVLKAFQEPFVLDGHELNITTSIGVAVYPDDGEDADTLLKNADVALYQAKQKGRNNYQYTSAMDPEL